VIPAAGGDGRVADLLARFGLLVPSARGVAVRLDGGEAGLAEIVRALDADGVTVDNVELHRPSLDDVFLAKTGRSLEGHGE
jgi:ABC-2 type transport system ATP-binding protein